MIPVTTPSAPPLPLPRRRSRLLPTLLVLAAAGVAAAEAPVYAASWSDAQRPTAGSARAIGGPAAGCIAGAARLPPDGVGYQAVRLSRHRNFGHPATVAFVERLGRRAAAAGLAPFYVGDMAQPRGGPMAFGHGSHQTGLDVDIWFNLDPKPQLRPEARETLDLPSMLLADFSGVDPKRFDRRQVQLLRFAASDPKVDRLFVNPSIKKALCEGVGGAGEGDRSWLRKVRPWRGHDEHFHVRLSCPADSPDCQPQVPVPPGDGCDASLDWWFRDGPPAPIPVSTRRPPAPPRPHLPAQCRAVLNGR